jgi:hypothetical protein
MQNRSQKLQEIFAYWYCAMAVFTFGYAASAASKQHAQELIECRVLFKSLSVASRLNGDPCWDGNSEGAYGLLAAVLWPLYWSWEAQSWPALIVT